MHLHSISMHVKFTHPSDLCIWCIKISVRMYSFVAFHPREKVNTLISCTHSSVGGELVFRQLMFTYQNNSIFGLFQWFLVYFDDFNLFSDINECEPNPCENGDCVQGINSFTCVNCDVGYSGPFCSPGELFLLYSRLIWKTSLYSLSLDNFFIFAKFG